MSWVSLDAAERVALKRAARILPHGLTRSRLLGLVDRCAAAHAASYRHERAIAIARAALPADDGFAIDPVAPVSESDEGVWVGAWVWVARDEYAARG